LAEFSNIYGAIMHDCGAIVARLWRDCGAIVARLWRDFR